MSNIIKDMLQRMDPKRYDKRGKDGVAIPMDVVKVQGGMAFEKALEATFSAAGAGVFRPDPIWVPVPGSNKIIFAIPGLEDSFPKQHAATTGQGGVWCSPDAIDSSPVLLIREFKLTWYSGAKEFPGHEVYWPYLVQVKGYCKAVGTRYAALTIMHINGDYHPPAPWEPITYGLEFEEWEVEENWDMLVNHAKSLGWL